MSDMPTLQEEINRKALNALAMVQHNKENFKISEETYRYVMKVLWESFAGIVDGSFAEIMEQMDAEPYLKPSQILYKKGEDYVLLDVDLPAGRTSIRKNGQSVKVLENSDRTVMKAHLGAITKQLIEKGYTKYVK